MAKKKTTKKKKKKTASTQESSIEELIDGVNENAPENYEARYRELKRDYRALKRKMDRGQGTEDRIREAISEIYDDYPSKLIMPKRPKLSGRGDEHIAIAHISDVQLGKITEDYDSNIGAERIRIYAERVAQYAGIYRSFCKVTKLRLYLGGDMVEGETGNYPSQPYDVDSSVVRQAMRGCSDIFEALIYYLLEHFDHIHVVGVVGNHGRGAPFKATRHKETNWDRVFYWNLQDRVLGTDLKPDLDMRKRVTMDMPGYDKFYAIDRVFDWGMLVAHGDQIRGWAGIPYYGVTKKVHGWSDTMPRHWDALFFGHFHTMASGTINSRHWYCNGTTESSNSFTLEQLAAAGPPCQRLLFVNAKHGIVADHPIWVAPRHPVMVEQVRKAAGEVGKAKVNEMIDVLFEEQGLL